MPLRLSVGDAQSLTKNVSNLNKSVLALLLKITDYVKH